MNSLVGAGEAEEVRRPLSVFKRFYNFLYGVLVTFFTLLGLEPVIDLLSFLIPRGARRLLLLFGPLMQWLPIYGSERVPSGFNGRVNSKNLVTKCLIGKGSSGIFYETTWLGCPQGSPGRLARKDFPGVKGDIFEREVIPLFELPDHPNLLKTLCWTVDNRSCSLVMEYMRDDLSSVVRGKKEELRKKQASHPGMGPAAPFELHEALEIAIQIATGMEYLHRTGITHGDLKANNIFIDWMEDKRMLVKLTDFGLLEIKRRSTMVSQRAFCFQMIEWSAPELFEDYFRSTSEDLDYLWTKSPIGLETSTSSVSTVEKSTEMLMTQADSYSFALLCAFVLGGQMWDANLSPTELRREIMSNPGLRPKLPSECPKMLRTLISLCWDANPAHRPDFSYILQGLQEEQRNLLGRDLRSLEPMSVPEKRLPSRDSISSVLIRIKNEDAFNDFHADLDIVIPLWLVKKLGSTSDGLRSAMLKNLEQEELVVSENIAGTGHDLRQLIEFRKRKKSEARESVLNLDNQKTTVGSGNLQELIGSLELNKFTRPETVHVMPFDLREAVYIMRRIASPMAFLHSKGVAHRDLKSTNILVHTHAGSIVVKIADFGLAEHIDSREKPRRGVGSRFWMAPELCLWKDEVKAVEDVEPCELKAADVYSFAMTCYEILTGQIPFQEWIKGSTGKSWKLAITEGLRPTLPPAELMSADLRRLIEQCWDKQPEKRPTFSYICTELQRIQQAMTTEQNLDDGVHKH